jgi:hypothetical protein
MVLKNMRGGQGVIIAVALVLSTNGFGQVLMKKLPVVVSGERFLYTDVTWTVSAGPRVRHIVLVHQDVPKYQDTGLFQTADLSVHLRMANGTIVLTDEGVYRLHDVAGESVLEQMEPWNSFPAYGDPAVTSSFVSYLLKRAINRESSRPRRSFELEGKRYCYIDTQVETTGEARYHHYIVIFPDLPRFGGVEMRFNDYAFPHLTIDGMDMMLTTQGIYYLRPEGDRWRLDPVEIGPTVLLGPADMDVYIHDHVLGVFAPFLHNGAGPPTWPPTVP